MAKKNYELKITLTEKEHKALIDSAEDFGSATCEDYVSMLIKSATNDEIIQKMNSDLRKAAEMMPKQEARFLVDLYYQMQKLRIHMNNQVASMTLDAPEGKEEPCDILRLFASNMSSMEKMAENCLRRFVENDEVGGWMTSHKGVGPILAANLLASIDISKAVTAGAIYKFAGLDPTQEWKKGEKRPWNAKLKTACWKLGESFVKVSGKEGAFYGKIYREAKERYAAKNEAGGFAERAKEGLEKYGKTTEAYEHCQEGHLPPAHIQSMAKRYAVKLFLSHLQEVWWKHEFKAMPPKPYAIAILEHGHYIPVPNEPDWAKAVKS